MPRIQGGADVYVHDVPVDRRFVGGVNTLRRSPLIDFTPSVYGTPAVLPQHRVHEGLLTRGEVPRHGGAWAEDCGHCIRSQNAKPAEYCWQPLRTTELHRVEDPVKLHYTQQNQVQSCMLTLVVHGHT